MFIKYCKRVALRGGVRERKGERGRARLVSRQHQGSGAAAGSRFNSHLRDIGVFFRFFAPFFFCCQHVLFFIALQLKRKRERERSGGGGEGTRVARSSRAMSRGRVNVLAIPSLSLLFLAVPAAERTLILSFFRTATTTTAAA